MAKGERDAQCQTGQMTAHHEKRHSYAFRGINKYFIPLFTWLYNGLLVDIEIHMILDCTVFESIFDRTIT